MFCTQCGKGNPEGARFCAACGQPITAAAGSPAQIGARPARLPDDDPLASAHAGHRVGAAPAAARFDEEAFRAFVGPTAADHYLSRFRLMAAGGDAPRWHWPAFLVTLWWLLHRKMWWQALVYVIAPYFVAALLLAPLAAAAGANNEILGWVPLLVLLVFFVVPPLFAHSWYYSHARAVMEKHRTRWPSREQYLAALARRGGTSLVVVILLGAVPVIGILAAVALPAYHDYTLRAKSHEALLFGKSAATAVGRHYQRTGSVPRTLDEVGEVLAKPASVTTAQLNPNNGQVTLSVAGVGNLVLTPRIADSGIQVSCEAAESIGKAVLPRECRGD